MAEKSKTQFNVSDHQIEIVNSGTKIIIEGVRAGQPSKRFTLSRADLKIDSAKISHSRKNKVFEHEVTRINYLPKVSQTRIHTTSLLYPGQYKLELVFKGNVRDKIGQVNDLFS